MSEKQKADTRSNSTSLFMRDVRTEEDMQEEFARYQEEISRKCGELCIKKAWTTVLMIFSGSVFFYLYNYLYGTIWSFEDPNWSVIAFGCVLGPAIVVFFYRAFCGNSFLMKARFYVEPRMGSYEDVTAGILLFGGPGVLVIYFALCQFIAFDSALFTVPAFFVASVVAAFCVEATMSSFYDEEDRLRQFLEKEFFYNYSKKYDVERLPRLTSSLFEVARDMRRDTRDKMCESIFNRAEVFIERGEREARKECDVVGQGISRIKSLRIDREVIDWIEWTWAKTAETCRGTTVENDTSLAVETDKLEEMLAAIPDESTIEGMYTKERLQIVCDLLAQIGRVLDADDRAVNKENER